MDGRFLEDLRTLLPGLHPREREMATRMFGLDGSPPLSRQEAAAFFGVTVERIDQVRRHLERLVDEGQP